MEDLNAEGRIILKWIFKKWDGEARTVAGLAEDRDGWWALVNTVMNSLVPLNARNLSTS